MNGMCFSCNKTDVELQRWLDAGMGRGKVGVCVRCEADARLGRLVQQIPIGGMVRRGDSSICGFPQGKEWLVLRVFGLPEYGETLESAMIKAGIEGDK